MIIKREDMPRLYDLVLKNQKKFTVPDMRNMVLKDPNASPYLPEGTYFSDVVSMQGYERAKDELKTANLYVQREYNTWGVTNNDYKYVKRWISAMASVIRWQRQLIKARNNI